MEVYRNLAECIPAGPRASTNDYLRVAALIAEEVWEDGADIQMLK